MPETPITQLALTNLHSDVAAPYLQRILEQLERIEIRLERIELRRERGPRGIHEVLERVDELGLRFEGTENCSEQLAYEVRELRTRVGHMEESIAELIALQDYNPAAWRTSWSH